MNRNEMIAHLSLLGHSVFIFEDSAAQHFLYFFSPGKTVIFTNIRQTRAYYVPFIKKECVPGEWRAATDHTLRLVCTLLADFSHDAR